MLGCMSDKKEPELNSDADADTRFDEEDIEGPVSSQDLANAKKEIAARCKSAGLTLEEGTQIDESPLLKLGMKCGRGFRWLFLGSDEIVKLLSIPFETFVFLTDYEAVCSYKDGFIEAAIRPIGAGFAPASFVFRRL